MGYSIDNLYLQTETARRLYDRYAKDLPIVDYHCHLSPQEICENQRFDNIGEIWLAGDHYKWRLMRTYGVDEKYITGNASWLEKFKKYAEVISLSVGCPLYYWTAMELSMYFGISEKLTAENAEEIWERANGAICDRNITPRKLIEMSKVQYIGTTDDPCDTLIYHEKLQKDTTFHCTVVPSFRADNLLLIRNAGFKEYVKTLQKVTSTEIHTLEDYLTAISMRLDHFKAMGCRFADVGIEFFPKCIGTYEQAEHALDKAMHDKDISEAEYHAFLGYLYCFLGGEYKKRDIVSQMHIAVKRNPNSELFRSFGPDAGADCIGEEIAYWDIIHLLNTMQEQDALPRTIIYTLNPAMVYAIATITGGFRNVHCGAAWWFCDHKRGIEEHLHTFAETGHLSTFLGMTTDSRSFLSYARHDYFRRILCSVIAEWMDQGEAPADADCIRLLRAVCYENAKELVGI